MTGVIIKNEFLKVSKQKKPLVFLILVTLLVAGLTFMSKINTQNIMPNENFSSFVSGMQQLVSIFGILLIAETFTEDFKNGTIKMSVIQPINRESIIIGKLIYIALSVIIMEIVIIIITYISTLMFIGATDMDTVLSILKSAGLTSIVLFSFLTIVALLATLISAPSAVTSLGIVLLFLSPTVVTLISMVSWIPKNTMFFLLPTYFGAFFNQLPEVNNLKIYATIAIALPMVLCTLASMAVFKRKELNF